MAPRGASPLAQRRKGARQRRKGESASGMAGPAPGSRQGGGGGPRPGAAKGPGHWPAPRLPRLARGAGRLSAARLAPTEPGMLPTQPLDAPRVPVHRPARPGYSAAGGLPSRRQRARAGAGRGRRPVLAHALSARRRAGNGGARWAPSHCAAAQARVPGASRAARLRRRGPGRPWRGELGGAARRCAPAWHARPGRAGPRTACQYGTGSRPQVPLEGGVASLQGGRALARLSLTSIMPAGSPGPGQE
jgi:hypothetical protein